MQDSGRVEAVAPRHPEEDLPPWVTRNRSRYPWFDRLVTAGESYGYGNIEFFAMKVVSRGLFLAVTMLLLLLYCLAYITSQLPGVNEIAIPTMALPDQVDLGAAVERAYESTRGAVIGLLGAVTLVVSATFTAKALRQGIRSVFPTTTERVRTLDLTNLLIGVALAVLGVALWLMTLGTAIRTSAIRQLLGVTELSPWLVAGGKFTLIVAQWALLAAIVSRTVRRHGPMLRQRDVLFAGAAFSAFVTLLNFLMIYSYIRALFDPDTSGSIVLVLSLLTWVNVVVRGFFLTMCWAAVPTRSPPGGRPSIHRPSG